MSGIYKNLISTLVVASLVLVPFSVSVRLASAQNPNLNPSGYASQGITGYIGKLSPIIRELPTCRAVLQDSIKNLFSPKVSPEFVGPVLSNKDKRMQQRATTRSLREKEAEAKVALEGVLISDPNNLAEIKALQLKIDNIQADIDSLNQNAVCLESIGRLVIKTLLQKMTVSTVAWIQSGFEGEPYYIENTSDFLLDLARTEVLAFGVEISDQTIFPFGKEFMTRQATYFNRSFAENARYSLDELISETSGYTADDFKGDFSKGGWGGWIGMTTRPANNPLGFELLASEELGGRINNTVDDINQRLEQADGFLGDQRCVEPENISKEMHNAALASAIKIPVYDPITGKKIGDVADGACERWEYVTPGKMVAQAATNLVDFGKDSLLEADDLNAAVATLLDTLLNKWTQDIITKGFAGLGTGGSEGYLQIDQSHFGYNYVPTQVESDFSAPSITGWLADNPHFNIRTDLTQALIDEQRTFILKAKEENKVLNDLIKTIRQLDYCIPGPHPGWYQDSRRALSGVENSIVSKTPADMEDAEISEISTMIEEGAKAGALAIGIAIGGSLGGPLGALAGFLIGLFIDLLDGPSNEKKLDRYYAGIMRLWTGVHMSKPHTEPAKIANKHEVTNGLDTIFGRYAILIEKYFTPGFLPTVAPEAETKFRQIPGYQQIIEENTDQIVALESAIQRLARLKETIDNINANFAALGPDPTQGQIDLYEASLKDHKEEFARISGDLVSGDDIALIDTTMKQARSEIKHVYKDLLIGPYGCEQDLLFNRQPTFTLDPTIYPPINPPADPSKTSLIRKTLRAEYPFPLWYDYNDFGANATLIVPPGIIEYLELGPGEQVIPNQMPSYTIGDYGPGFLSSVFFDYTEGTSCSNRPLHPWELDCLKVSDLFLHVNSWPVSVGKRLGDISNGNSDVNDHNQQTEWSFEQTIGIY